jgi:hypothetical protein
VSGGTGASVTTNAVNVSAQTASVTINTGTACATLTISDSTDSATATILALVPVNSAGFYFSPHNWYLSGSSFAATNCAGSYFYFKFSGTSAVLNLDQSTFSAGSFLTVLRVSVDGGPVTNTTITGTTATITLGTGLANTTHTITAWVVSRGFGVDSWTTTPLPSNAIKILGMTVSSGATMSAPTVRTKTAIFYGDSRVEGAGTVGGLQDATVVAAAYIAEALNCEYSIRAFSGMGYSLGGDTNVPPLFTPASDTGSSWNKFFAGTSLLSAGQFTLQPDYVFVLNLGVNDAALGQTNTTIQAAVQGFIGAARSAAPNANIFINATSYDGYAGTPIAAAYSAVQSTPDPKLYLLPVNLSAAERAAIDIGNSIATYLTSDGKHPTSWGQALIAARLMKSVQQILDGQRNFRGAF